MKQDSFPLSGFVVRYFIGTMNPSDSLPAVMQFPLSVYMPSVYGLPCRGGSLQFHTILSLHADSHTPEDSSVVLQVPSTFRGLHPYKRDSASSCSRLHGRAADAVCDQPPYPGPFLTMRQNSLHYSLQTRSPCFYTGTSPSRIVPRISATHRDSLPGSLAIIRTGLSPASMV